MFRTLVGGRSSVHTHVLLPSPWFCCLASLSLGWASGHGRGTGRCPPPPALTRACTFHAHRASTSLLRSGLRERVCLVSDSAAADVSGTIRALITVSCAVGKVGLREAVPLLVSTTESASRGLNADLGPSTWSNLSLASVTRSS